MRRVIYISRSDRLSAALVSPPTRNGPAPAHLLDAALMLFGLAITDLDPRIPPAIVEAGARHLLLALNDRDALAAMRYDMKAGAELMREWSFATISLVHAETLGRFHARNPFAAGGAYEDPATGAAAAALAGYLQALGIKEAGTIEIVQGEDMGVPCLLHASAPASPGGGARVHGTVRRIEGRHDDRQACRLPCRCCRGAGYLARVCRQPERQPRLSGQ